MLQTAEAGTEGDFRRQSGGNGKMHNGENFQHIEQVFQCIGNFNEKSRRCMSKILDNEKRRMGDLGAINCED